MRVAFALAGGGSLGTFVSAAVREVLLAIEGHNRALAGEAERSLLLHDEWGPVIVDAIGGSSAGALCGAQVVRALFDSRYLGAGLSLDALGTLTGDWVAGGSFRNYATDNTEALVSGPIASPGWTILNGTRLFQRTRGVLDPRSRDGGPPIPHTALDPAGVVGFAATLTDTFGFHEPAEFEPHRVLGHPSFGLRETDEPHYFAGHLDSVRDLGVRNHGEVRRLFLCAGDEVVGRVAQSLRDERREHRARAMVWDAAAAESIAALAAASASLPFAFGPIALRDRAVDDELACTRLYMDGGTLNNRPIEPALNVARWGDAARLAPLRASDGTYARDDILAHLDYERVCFFVDAFPDPVADEWLSPHPEVAQDRTGLRELDGDAQRRRAARIRAVLDGPGSGLDLFAESLLSSLRAQDIRDIAKLNFRLRKRRLFIEQRCASPPDPRPQWRVDSLARAEAYAAVLAAPCGRALPDAVARAVAERVWESDQISGLSGRREVTMVPVFSPRNRDGALAGEGLYTLGGLLSLDSRMHDARVGTVAARHVLRGVADPAAALEDFTVPNARPEVLPDDAGPVVERLRLVAQAALTAAAEDSAMARWLSSLPMLLEPLFRRLGRRLDVIVQGIPDPEEDHDDIRLPGEDEDVEGSD